MCPGFGFQLEFFLTSQIKHHCYCFIQLIIFWIFSPHLLFTCLLFLFVPENFWGDYFPYSLITSFLGSSFNENLLVIDSTNFGLSENVFTLLLFLKVAGGNALWIFVCSPTTHTLYPLLQLGGAIWLVLANGLWTEVTCYFWAEAARIPSMTLVLSSPSLLVLQAMCWDDGDTRHRKPGFVSLWIVGSCLGGLLDLWDIWGKHEINLCVVRHWYLASFVLSLFSPV